MSTPTNYPLAWPFGWRRTAPADRKLPKFRTRRESDSWAKPISIAEGVRRVQEELAHHGVHRNDMIISSNVETRLDGTPRSDRAPPADPGVAVYWRANGADRCMAIDAYTTVAGNLAAIAATLDAMRAIERHGGAEVGARSFAGFKALPAPGQDSAVGWRTVFGFSEGDRPLLEVVEARYRRMVADAHPDRGGSVDATVRLNKARDQARAELAP